MRIVLIILGVLGLLVVLDRYFPYAAQHSQNQSDISYMAVLLIAVLAGSAVMRREHLPKMMQHIAVWICIFIVLILGYSMKDRLAAELLPNRIQTSASGEMTVKRAEDGHFHIQAEVNGAIVDFMVDTGASDIVLSPADAKRAGFNPEALRYDQRTQTANGIGGGASVTAQNFVVGQMVFNDMPMTVNQAYMDGSLLGMRFLEQLQSYHVTGDTLTLIP
ncbi:MAG: TIGR02281 family clan AA aspartic protease [Rickettsiales bacterium]|nr:TIGR02281 family clan AA aspartic protease [Rickettsiales bacterium]